MKTNGLTKVLTHPLMKGLDLDDPQTTLLRRQIILQKPFLKSVYQDWYHLLAESIPPRLKPVLEIGSGAGFLDEIVQDVISSEIFYLPTMQVVLDAQQIPFSDASLDGIVMTDVFHHIRNPRGFLHEAARTVRKGGVLAMIEPWRTNWSEFVYKCFHHEPFDPDAKSWELPSGGPLSAANGALPWIIFYRERARFEGEFPEWSISSIRPIMPFRYLVSGGVSLRSLMPGWSYSLWKTLEKIISPLNPALAMFAVILIKRV